MPQNLNVRLPHGHRFFAKNGSFGYGAKSWWGPPRVNLGAYGVPLGLQKWVKTAYLPLPQIRIFDYPAVIDFSKKNGSYGYGTKSRWGPLGSFLGPMGSHWVQKMAQKRKKLPCPKIRILDYPVVIYFSKNMEVMVMAPNHSGDP